MIIEDIGTELKNHVYIRIYVQSLWLIAQCLATHLGKSFGIVACSHTRARTGGIERRVSPTAYIDFHAEAVIYWRYCVNRC